MKILVLGSGGREHALTWKLRESQQMEEIYCAPGNAGIAQEAECRPVDLSSPQEILALAQQLKADLTVVGPEAPIVAGVVDEFEKAGLWIIGPSKAAGRLEGSKVFAKQFMQRHRIPTAQFMVAENFDEAVRGLSGFQLPVVVKADGLAAGKGVVVASTRDAEFSHRLYRPGRKFLHSLSAQLKPCPSATPIPRRRDRHSRDVSAHHDAPLQEPWRRSAGTSLQVRTFSQGFHHLSPVWQVNAPESRCRMMA